MSKLPLWEVMRGAYDTSPPAPMDAGDDWTDRHGYAAEIRAVRDWLVPEESVDNSPPLNGWITGGTEWCISKERQRLRALLTAEAVRAEREEVEA